MNDTRPKHTGPANRSAHTPYRNEHASLTTADTHRHATRHPEHAPFQRLTEMSGLGTATVTGRGTLGVDTSVRNEDFRWPPAGTSRGHQQGPHLATSGDFFMATDMRTPHHLVECGSDAFVKGTVRFDV